MIVEDNYDQVDNQPYDYNPNQNDQKNERNIPNCVFDFERPDGKHHQTQNTDYYENCHPMFRLSCVKPETSIFSIRIIQLDRL